MSIGFSFTARALRPEHFLAEVRALAEAWQEAVQCSDDSAWVTLAPMGEVFITLESEGAVSGQCQSTPAGPGLHKAALDFVRALAEGSLSELSIEDETDYAVHGDFEWMKQEHFYPWLRTLVELGSQYESSNSNICFCWDLDQYRPEDIPCTVVTPLGRFDLAKMAALVKQEGIEALAQRFFVWEHETKDALYHRNKALNGLWEHCYYRPSARSPEDAYINDLILDELELSMQMDQTLAQPLEEYQALCQLAGRQAQIPPGVVQMAADFPIGYRQGDVWHSFGNLDLCLPGSFQYETFERTGGGTDHLWSDDTTGCWFRVSGFTLQEAAEDFLPNLFEDCQDIRTVEIGQGGRLRMGYVGAVEEDGQLYYQIVAQALSGQQVTLITVSFDEAQARDELMAQLGRMRAVGARTIEEKTYDASEGEDVHG